MGAVKINLDFLHESQGLYKQVQSIAGKLKSPGSLKEVHQLTHELDVTCFSLKVMKDKAAKVFEQSPIFGGIEEEIVALYGQIDAEIIQRHVSMIQEETGCLQKAMSEGHLSAKNVDVLKKHIYLFLKDHRPSVSDRRVIADATRTVQEATCALEKGSPKKVMNHFDCLAQHHRVSFAEERDPQPGECEEILDVARLVHQGKNDKAKILFNQLSYEDKQEIRAHMVQLKGELFGDRLETLQALFATVNDLVGNGESYPTQKEIDEVFFELQELIDQDEGASLKIQLN